MSNLIDLRDHIRTVPDFPKPGIMFRDITPLLSHPPAFGEAVKQLADKFRDVKIDAILAAEARGFIFAAPLSLELQSSFVPVRKPGKLPFETQSFEYELEYGTDTLEIHIDAIREGDNVLLIDDLLATGGTMQACVKLAEQSGANVIGCGFVVELDALAGREKLGVENVHSLIHY